MSGPYLDVRDIRRDLLRQWEEAGSAPGRGAMTAAEPGPETNPAADISLTAQILFAQAYSNYLTAKDLQTRADVSAATDRPRPIEGSHDVAGVQS
ncbi:MAG: hypothetical protein V7632_1534 [Bradyrhizobium sp.]